MNHQRKRKFADFATRQDDASPSSPAKNQVILSVVTGSATLAILLLCSAVAPAQKQANSAEQLRQFIDQQVGGIHKLQVPSTNADIPVPLQADGTVPYRYETTEAKRYLGKLLFHDPIRTARIDPAFGGILATKQTGSCGSCHLGEAAGKAGAVLNFNVGGEGRGYTDENGNFIIRRRTRSDLPIRRSAPLFPGDTLVDELPTLTDVYLVPPPPGMLEVDTPARMEKLPLPLELVATGRLDALDSVGRQSPSMIGFAFNNRLLLGGFAGEPNSAPGGLNPYNDPAQENLTLLLLDAHRMLNAESGVLQQYPAFNQLFRDAFPMEAQMSDATGNIDLLINDQTVFRATSTFLRTAVTRNTPFDRFLAGRNGALTASQQRGARLFFTPATNGMGGAGCFSCHSGPMLNKQHNDPDVAGIGKFVEQNFINVGIGDHPLQALNRLARNDPNFHDEGRKEITRLPGDAFKFRVVTLRQLKDARTFFHNGSFTSVRDVVEYFNHGVPQDPAAGSSPTLSPLFTHPRGPGSPRGLGLSESQVNDLTDFLTNALYDPAFAKYDPNSSTDSFELNEHDLTYSEYHPDLAMLGAQDGFVISGLAMNNNDALTRRDEGLEFLDVTSHLMPTWTTTTTGQTRVDSYTFTNFGSSAVDTHLLVIVQGLPSNILLSNASGVTSVGDPYVRIFLPKGVLPPLQSVNQQLVFTRQPGAPPVSYTLKLLSGQGNP